MSLIFCKSKLKLTIEVDLKLSTLKPIHVKVMTNIYNHFKEEGCKTVLNDWKIVGVVGAAQDASGCATVEFNHFALVNSIF